MFRNHRRAARAVALLIAIPLILSAAVSALAQEGQECNVGVVGWEVFSTNTPGGGGQLQSQGLTGEQTAWTITHVAPSVAGSAVTNVVVTYYHCKECRDKAKKKQEEEKKKREEEKKKKEEEKKKKKKAGKPKEGEPVPTFDPRTHELKDGKVVPKDPKKTDDHKNCPKPPKFECGEHYRWWLENHDHVQAKPDVEGHEHCDVPEKFECGQHYLWWLKNHKHRTEAEKPKAQEPKRDPYQYDGLDRKVREHSMVPDKAGMQIIMTGTVVSGEEATVSVVDAQGALISGVVLELPDGQTTTTDEKGRARFKVPFGKEALTLMIAGTMIQKSAWSWNSGAKPNTPTLPRPDQPSFNPPSVVQPGQPITVPTEGLTPEASLYLNNNKLEPLASSPTQKVVDIPFVPVSKPTWFVVRSTDPMWVQPYPVDIVQIQVDPPKTLVQNQTAEYIVTVVGTDKPVVLGVDNDSPTVVTLERDFLGGFIQSSGGAANVCRIRLKAIGPGQIRLPVRLIGEAAY